MLTKRFDNNELINFAVGVKRKCLENKTTKTAEVWNQLQQQSKKVTCKVPNSILKTSASKQHKTMP